MRRPRLTAALVLALALMAGGACGGDDDDGVAAGEEQPGSEKLEPLEVGAALSLTGKLAREGLLTREGYEYCLDVVNAKGGVKVGETRQPLEIKFEDDQSTPDVASRLVDQMHSSGLDLILGPYGSASTEAAAAAVEKNGQTMVEGAGADDNIFTKGYRNTFAVLALASDYLTSIVKSLDELAQPKPATVAILSADDGFSRTAADAGKAAAEKAGMKVVADESVPNGATDVSSAITKIKGRNPDLVLGAVHLAEGIAMVKQSKELGLRPAGGMGETVAPPTPDFVSTLGKDAEGVVGSSQWTVESSGKDGWFGTGPDYAAGFKAKFGHEPSYHNVEASAACLIMVLGVEKAGSADPEAVRSALSGLDVETVFGPVRFDEAGRNVAKTMTVIQIQDGKAVTVWPTGPGVQPLRWPAPPGQAG